jgi:formate--tetrahydrofolate ligase
MEKDPCAFRFLYDVEMSLKDKISRIATEMYGAKRVEYETAAQRHLRTIEEAGLGNMMVCMAKTQLSLTDKPELKGAPTDWELTVREIFVSQGAGFVVPICGRIMLIPGLPSRPSALGIDIDEDGRITGLY